MGEGRTAHPYYMHEAIWEQPNRVVESLTNGQADIARAAEAAATRRRLLLVGIGTSYHAAQVGEHFLRHLTRGRAQVRLEQSFELVHYPLALGPDDAVIAISHRGWKNYSVQALRAARAAGAVAIAVTGRAAATSFQDAEFVLTTCEQEVSFAHTKSYTAALAVLAALAIGVAERRGDLIDATSARAALAGVPEQMRQALGCEPACRELARQIARRQRWVFVGAGPNWATACEAALKVKETGYLAADGQETEQFLHGPLSEMDSRAALTALLTGGPCDARTKELLRAVGELGVLRIAVAPRGTGDVPAEHRLEVPAVPEWLSPFVQVVAAQLLSYYVALERGCNPDLGREEQPEHARSRQHFKL